jgi:hypothetical protein
MRFQVHNQDRPSQQPLPPLLVVPNNNNNNNKNPCQKNAKEETRIKEIKFK